MVRLSLSLLAAPVASGYLANLIVPPEEVPGRSEVDDPRWDALRDVFDQILESHGYDEAKLSSLPKWLVSHHNVTMRDGTKINTLVVNPPELKRRPAIVSRSPYGTLGSNAVALVFTVLNGYTAVIQDQRGTQKSEGVFDLWTAESTDSTDVAEWVSKQLWSNGDVYYTGGSADGMPGNMAVLDDPKRLKGEWLIWTAENGHNFAYPQGAYREDLMRGYLTSEAGDTHGSSRDLVLPKVESKESYDSWWKQITLCRNLSSPSEQPCYYNRIKWPVVDSVGWWDLFQHTHLTHWKGIRTFSDESVRDQHVLVVGPLGHCIGGAPFKEQPIFATEEANGLVVAAEVASELFKGEIGNMRSKVGRVNLFIMGSFHGDLLSGGNYWTSLDDFPSPEPTKLFLSAEGSLQNQPPAEAAQASYVYDPSAEDGATPMFGGNNLPGIGRVKVCGSADQMPRANRSDVVIFDSAPLTAEMPIAGELSAEIFVSSSAKDTDFFVTVEDLEPKKQKSMLVRYGMARMRWRDSDVTMSLPLEADEVYRVNIELWASAYIFPKGHRVRVTVSSAAYPYYNLNPNTGNPLYTPDDKPVAASNVVHISPEFPSSVSLPVVSSLDIPKNPDFIPGLPTVVV